MQKTAFHRKSGPSQSVRPQKQSGRRTDRIVRDHYAPHANAIDDRLETLSANTPAPSAPNRHPNSSTAADVFVRIVPKIVSPGGGGIEMETAG
jgi:hypothetical protein